VVTGRSRLSGSLVGVAAVVVVVVVTGCTPHPVGPARTFGKYEGKAVTTAESALSQVQTVRLAAQVAGDDGAFGPYLSVLISDQEEALSGVQGTFASIQPPDTRADALREKLDQLLTVALGHVADARIAARRGDLDGVAELGGPLGDDAAALAGFVEEHGR
jgi:hypothetical protein